MSKDEVEKVNDEGRETNWTCETDFEVDGLPKLEPAEKNEVSDKVPLNQMTVGRKFLLRCQGEPVFLKRADIKLISAEKKPFVLELLEVRRLDEKSGDFLMTSYQAGKHEIANTQLSDGKNIVGVEKFSLQVGTVVKPKKGKPPEPFGPFGPIQLSWPLIVWIVLGVIAFSFLSGVIYSVVRTIKRRKMLKDLEQYKTALSPFDQFNKDIRGLKRKLDFARIESGNKTLQKSPAKSASKSAEEVGNEDSSPAASVLEVEKALRLYLVRELQIPALDWGEKLIFKDLKSRHRPIFDQCKDDIKVTFREITKAAGEGQKLSQQDFQLLLGLSQKTVSAVWRENQKRQREKN